MGLSIELVDRLGRVAKKVGSTAVRSVFEPLFAPRSPRTAIGYEDLLKELNGTGDETGKKQPSQQ